MTMSTILSLLGLGVICWVLFSLAVYALPFFLAVTVGHTLYTWEVGLISAIAAAFIAGAATRRALRASRRHRRVPRH